MCNQSNAVTSIMFHILDKVNLDILAMVGLGCMLINILENLVLEHAIHFFLENLFHRFLLLLLLIFLMSLHSLGSQQIFELGTFMTIMQFNFIGISKHCILLLCKLLQSLPTRHIVDIFFFCMGGACHRGIQGYD